MPSSFHTLHVCSLIVQKTYDHVTVNLRGDGGGGHLSQLFIIINELKKQNYVTMYMYVHERHIHIPEVGNNAMITSICLTIRMLQHTRQGRLIWNIHMDTCVVITGLIRR